MDVSELKTKKAHSNCLYISWLFSLRRILNFCLLKETIAKKIKQLFSRKLLFPENMFFPDRKQSSFANDWELLIKTKSSDIVIENSSHKVFYTNSGINIKDYPNQFSSSFFNPNPFPFPVNTNPFLFPQSNYWQQPQTPPPIPQAYPPMNLFGPSANGNNLSNSSNVPGFTISNSTSLSFQITINSIPGAQSQVEKMPLDPYRANMVNEENKRRSQSNSFDQKGEENRLPSLQDARSNLAENNSERLSDDQLPPIIQNVNNNSSIIAPNTGGRNGNGHRVEYMEEEPRIPPPVDNFNAGGYIFGDELLQ